MSTKTTILALGALLLFAACGPRPSSSTSRFRLHDGTPPEVVEVSLGDGTQQAQRTNKLMIKFSKPMNPALVSIGDYYGNVSCAEYGAEESIQIAVDQYRTEWSLEDRCMGGRVATEDNITFVVTMNTYVELGDRVHLSVRNRTLVYEGYNALPMLRIVTDMDGVEMEQSYAARFVIEDRIYASMPPVWTKSS